MKHWKHLCDYSAITIADSYTMKFIFHFVQSINLCNERSIKITFLQHTHFLIANECFEAPMKITCEPPAWELPPKQILEHAGQVKNRIARQSDSCRTQNILLKFRTISIQNWTGFSVEPPIGPISVPPSSVMNSE